MKRRLLVVAAAVGMLFAAGVVPARAVLVTFTGDVEADFPEWALFEDQAGVGDVGIPPSAPAGTTVGWDLENVGVVYDVSTDTLYVGFNMGNDAISGDADGDGDPSRTAEWLSERGGSDLPNLTGTEAIDILIDADQSCELGSSSATDYEAVAGIPNTAGISGFRVATFSQEAPDFTTPGAGYTSPDFSGAVFASPSAEQPDLEFQIDNFCADILSLAGGTCVPGVTPISFAIRARAGSASDNGVGEDAIACTDIDYTPTAVSWHSVEVSAAKASNARWLGFLALALLFVTGSVGLLQRRR